ncbi:transposase [Arthrobacter sp. ISL-30]|uniref:IS110 family transposase n=1 Tax=Arthrobacter sp. ISL-30 TaxID=2819109 RepID=UPI0035B47B6D
MHLRAGIDAGKAHHHCVVIDADGNRLLSQKIPNDEPALIELIANVLKLSAGDDVVWATDLNQGGPALLIALLLAHGQHILYIPGRIVQPRLPALPGRGKDRRQRRRRHRRPGTHAQRPAAPAGRG